MFCCAVDIRSVYDTYGSTSSFPPINNHIHVSSPAGRYTLARCWKLRYSYPHTRIARLTCETGSCCCYLFNARWSLLQAEVYTCT